MPSQDFNTPSCGQSFDEDTIEDLSHLGAGWPAFGNSMGASNTLTDKAYDQLGAPGSASEATNDIDGSHGTAPELDLGDEKSYTRRQS
jgi:hypothetical protein